MKKLKIITLALIFVLTGTQTIFAQNDKSDYEKWKEQQNKEMQGYKDKKTKEFEEYRAKINAEYAEFLSKRWEDFNSQRAVPAPKAPEPVKQPKVEPETKPTAEPVPVAKIAPLPKILPTPQPIVPITPPEPEKKEQPAKEPPQTPKNDTGKVPTPSFSFLFFNTDCKVNWTDELRFTLPDVSEQNVANAWKKLSSSQYNTLLSDCLSLRDKLNLSDWGYYQLLKTMSEKIYGKSSSEAVLLQMFILTQSGYKVRIAKTGGKLALLIPFTDTIYEYSYLTIGGVKYYIVNKELQGSSFAICNHEFPKEQYFSWQTKQPKLTEKLNSPKTFTSKEVPNLNLAIRTNQSLIDYYNSYPLSSQWNLYTLAGFSETVKQILYPALQQAIAGKSKTQAADILLRFLQTAFAYQTDDQQFGYERPFFPDENFFYPYNNCKDRAILYCILVKDLLNLEAVLLEYPQHLSTAVYFPDNVNGDYLTYNNKKFLICDPTYIGANIGMAMPECKKTSANVVPIW